MIFYIEIWPEFTGQGKETATVAQLMRHELGKIIRFIYRKMNI